MEHVSILISELNPSYWALLHLLLTFLKKRITDMNGIIVNIEINPNRLTGSLKSTNTKSMVNNKVKDIIKGIAT